jgi:hypothetical protein
MAMASGLTLQLHLVGVDGPRHHDFTHCSLCQTILTGAVKLLIEPVSAVHWGRDLVAVVPEIGTVVWRWFPSVVLSPRPPPPRSRDQIMRLSPLYGDHFSGCFLRPVVYHRMVEVRYEKGTRLHLD